MLTVSNQNGTTMTEICCIIALICIAAISSMGFAGRAISNSFNQVGNSLNSESLYDVGFTPAENSLTQGFSAPAGGGTQR